MISPAISLFCVRALNCLQNSMMLICAWPNAGPTGGAGVALPASICNLTDVCTFFGAICSLFYENLFYENLYRLLWHRHSCLCSLNFLWTAGALACESLSSSVLWHRHSCLCSLNFLWTAGALACESLSSSVLWHRHSCLCSKIFTPLAISTL